MRPPLGLYTLARKCREGMEMAGGFGRCRLKGRERPQVRCGQWDDAEQAKISEVKSIEVVVGVQQNVEESVHVVIQCRSTTRHLYTTQLPPLYVQRQYLSSKDCVCVLIETAVMPNPNKVI